MFFTRARLARIFRLSAPDSRECLQCLRRAGTGWGAGAGPRGLSGHRSLGRGARVSGHHRFQGVTILGPRAARPWAPRPGPPWPYARETPQEPPRILGMPRNLWERRKQMNLEGSLTFFRIPEESGGILSISKESEGIFEYASESVGILETS